MGAKEDPEGVDDKTRDGKSSGGKHGGRGAQEAWDGRSPQEARGGIQGGERSADGS